MGPLEGIRVIDLSLHLAGPYASTLMGDMGAEVIRVERPGGDDDRRLGTEWMSGDSRIFVSRARNKKSLTLNLRSSEGQAVLERLVKISDVLLENYGPITRRKLNINYNSLRKVNPRLIMVSVSAYGSSGPSSGKIGFDPIAQAACGSMNFNGFPDDDRPARAQLSWVDYSTALHAAVGIMVALWHREKTGKGQHIDVSLYDSAVNLVGMQGTFADYLLEGIERPKTGNASLYVYADTFRTKDGWIFIHLGRNAVWQRFTKLIGKEELGKDPRFSDDTKRSENRKLIDDVVKPWVAERKINEIISLLDGARVPSQKVNTVAETLADSHLKARQMLIDIEYPNKGKLPIPGIVIKFSESPGEVRRRAPFLGEHNEEILAGLLGFTKEEISKLKERGII